MKTVDSCQVVMSGADEDIAEADNCSLCKFFALVPSARRTEEEIGSGHYPLNEFAGVCRRYPPRLSERVLHELIEEKCGDANTDRVDAAFTESKKEWPVVFPVVNAAMWCGEFQR